MQKKMRIYSILLLLLTSCTHDQSHPILLSNVSNYVRDIAPTDDFTVLKSWNDVLKKQPVIGSSKQPSYEIMYAINKECNRKDYKKNPVWPTPVEFRQSTTADCKGFVICKYYALRAAGFKPEQLNIWSGSYKGQSHLVLAAKLNNDYILDIGSESNLPLAKDYFEKKFRPAYRFNETGWDVN